MAVRVRRDPQFGPVIRFGAGGPDAFLSQSDRGMDLPPLNGFLARQLIERSRLWRRVLAPRVGHLAAEALQQALVQVSELVSNCRTSNRSTSIRSTRAKPSCARADCA